MFRGQFTHSVDAKGRISVPARFRDLVSRKGESRLVLTPAPFDPCLHVYPLSAWEAFEQKVSELPSLDRNIVRFRRLYVSAAVECELDKANRVLVPPHLREKAGLGREALWAGMGRLLELWSKPRFEEVMAISAEEEVAFERAVLEQIRI